MSLNVDDIWASLKKETSVNISHFWETTKTKKKKSSKPKTKNEVKTGVSKKSKRLFLLSSTEEKSNTHCNAEESKKRCENDDIEISSVERALAEDDITLLPSNLHGGDSDDDSDCETYPDQSNISTKADSIRMVKLQRMISLMQSDIILQRVAALKSLFLLTKSLHDKLEPLPPLNFPPPYDLSRITLTHLQHDSVVSDLAKGDHVKAWTRWQRTKFPISEQFLEKEEKDGVSSIIESETGITLDNGNSRAIRHSLQSIFDFSAVSLFRRFGDKSELCRSYAIDCVKLFCLSKIDMGKHLGYLMPAILGKYPPISFDDEMDVFVEDVDSHQFYKRGGATERQDRETLLSGSQTVKVVDSSEEIRLSLCELLSSIIRCFIQLDTSTTLDAYFTDIIFAVQSHLKDPFAKLKIAASNLLVQIVRVPRWELGAKQFATAISRAAIPNLRHRNSRVRISAIRLFEASISVPDREKIKGAGTSAIVDLVGFREENVLPIASFYKYECGVTVNSLAELAIDKSASVRLVCCEMLSFLVNCLPDRYDHHQRLLPYLLNFFHDDQEEVRHCAAMALESCGEQYEAEHSNEIIERRQYGVDGDERCNHIDSLPPPFKHRPRLGTRLFVRANTKRFFVALLNELTSWVSKTRIQSANLLSILVVYCEEHLTMDCHNTISGIVKAVQINMRETDNESKALHDILVHILELMGRYIDPLTYIKILLPRMIGDIDSATSFSEGGIHSESSCIANTIALQSMVKGTLPKILAPHSFTLISNLSSPDNLSKFKGRELKTQYLLALESILHRLRNESIAGAQSACFHATGRIHSSNEMIEKCKSSIHLIINDAEEIHLHELARGIAEKLDQMG